MTSPTWPISSASAFATRPDRALMSCISPPRALRHWIGSRQGSSPPWSLCCPTSTCPGMGGLQLLAGVTRRVPSPPIMMVTAYGDDERCRRADELGTSKFITKPVDFDLLKEHFAPAV